jgi:dienelactone hydrolase
MSTPAAQAPAGHAPTGPRSRAVAFLRSHALTLVALPLFALSAWQANRQVCPGCTSSDITLALADGTPIRARLYLPPAATAGIPAVVVCHGYLANLAFVEIPWAADLTRLGFATLFIDRRGHGISGGTLWPHAPTNQDVDDLEPDIAAALAYLRSLQPLIDPARIGVLGHSDGATAAITAASADWDVRATVAVSASVAPWDLVNHVAPQDLLLVYGADDHFVLNDTDGALIARGTRGYLAGPGHFGHIADGSARRLVRIPGRGHLDVLYSVATHREVLEWLRSALQPNPVVLASGDGETIEGRSFSLFGYGRFAWIWTGLGAIALALASGAAPLRRSAARPPVTAATAVRRKSVACAFIVALSWTVGLLFAPWLARHGQPLVPAQEGAVFGGLLLGPAIGLTVGGTLCLLFRLGEGTVMASGMRFEAGTARQIVDAMGRGVLIAAVVFIALRVLLLHHYEGALNLRRVVLLLIFAVLAAPTFGSLEFWLQRVAGERQRPAAASLALLATLTAALSGQLFERMSMAPGYLLAAVLLLCAAERIGRPLGHPLTRVTAGALAFSAIGAVVCALY